MFQQCSAVVSLCAEGITNVNKLTSLTVCYHCVMGEVVSDWVGDCQEVAIPRMPALKCEWRGCVATELLTSKAFRVKLL